MKNNKLMRRQLTAAAVAVLMTAGLTAGCGSNSGTTAENTLTASETSETESSESETAGTETTETGTTETETTETESAVSEKTGAAASGTQADGQTSNPDSAFSEALAAAVGDYTSSYDGSTMTISEDGSVQVGIYRLTEFDGAVSGAADGVLTFRVKDPCDEDMTMEFDTATGTLTVTESTWDYFPEDTTVDFAKDEE